MLKGIATYRLHMLKRLDAIEKVAFLGHNTFIYRFFN